MNKEKCLSTFNLLKVNESEKVLVAKLCPTPLQPHGL